MCLFVFGEQTLVCIGRIGWLLRKAQHYCSYAIVLCIHYYRGSYSADLYQ